MSYAFNNLDAYDALWVRRLPAQLLDGGGSIVGMKGERGGRLRFNPGRFGACPLLQSFYDWSLGRGLAFVAWRDGDVKLWKETVFSVRCFEGVFEGVGGYPKNALVLKLTLKCRVYVHREKRK